MELLVKYELHVLLEVYNDYLKEISNCYALNIQSLVICIYEAYIS